MEWEERGMMTAMKRMEDSCHWAVGVVVARRGSRGLGVRSHSRPREEVMVTWKYGTSTRIRSKRAAHLLKTALRAPCETCARGPQLRCLGMDTMVDRRGCGCQGGSAGSVLRAVLCSVHVVPLHAEAQGPEVVPLLREGTYTVYGGHGQGSPQLQNGAEDQVRGPPDRPSRMQRPARRDTCCVARLFCLSSRLDFLLAAGGAFPHSEGSAPRIVTRPKDGRFA